jgi:hypothetical protein
MMATSPREFAVAMRDLVHRSQEHPATAVSEQAYHMKLQILDHFIKHDTDPDAFQRMLRERIVDPDPRKGVSNGICCQILNSWQSGSCLYTLDGKLVLKALYPAEPPPVLDDKD